jgi:hypothetical protein
MNGAECAREQEAVRMKPLVSVVIPMFNARATIGRALESLQAQTLAQWGALVVDDGSTDGSSDVVRGMAQEDPRITLLHQSNRGPGAARNAAIDRADGWFIQFLDADDWLEPGGLRALVDRASDGGAAFGRTRLVGPRGETIGSGAGRTSAIPAGSGGGRIGLDDLLEDNPIQLSAAMVRRDVLADIRFSEHLRFALDYDIWLRLAARGTSFRPTPEIVGAYRLRPDGQSRNATEQLRAIDAFLAEAYASARESTAPRPEPVIDATETRRTRVMARFAMRRATAVAVGPGVPRERAASAIDMLASYADSARRVGWAMGGPEAGRAAFESVLHTTCATPDPRDGAAWTRGLAAFWRSCVERAWADASMIDAARAELALETVDPDRIASVMLDRAAGMGKTITIVGLGNNGRALATAALARGMKVLGRDDAIDAGDPAAPKGVTIEPPLSPLAREGAVIVSPLLDDVLAARVGGMVAPDRVLRWSITRAALASDALRELDSVWDAQPARLVA